ncbi:hypothetical protein EVAR_97131_1 [Eumeta japonica]|uniref:Uncharacterized protein n=1 Tax=Eumeta variegata TaxID=151549 RepID=A0A4C1WSN5_EUMVA|nr:hypothetical protein EVAR_97131_1 [Eumeta japonica]
MRTSFFLTVPSKVAPKLVCTTALGEVADARPPTRLLRGDWPARPRRATRFSVFPVTNACLFCLPFASRPSVVDEPNCMSVGIAGVQASFVTRKQRSRESKLMLKRISFRPEGSAVDLDHKRVDQ